MSAASESDLYNQLQGVGLELIECCLVGAKGRGGAPKMKRVKIRDLIQLFLHLNQMQGAGVPMLDALSDIRDTTENGALRDIMTEVYRDVSEGNALSEALAKNPKVFSNLYISLVRSGEETGDMCSAYRQLIKFLKWMDAMQSMVKKATRYPLILVFVVIIVVCVMMGFVVPQVVSFLAELDQELGPATTSLIATSNFFIKPFLGIRIFGFPLYGGIVVVLAPILFLTLFFSLRKMSDDLAYRIDSMTLSLPIAGVLVRKISIARFAQTFGALFASGIDVISALKSARETVSNRALGEAMETLIRHVQTGAPLSEAFNASGEFPSMVVRMVRIGEESGNLTDVLEQVSEFYTKDVDEAVQALITMIEPLLTVILGGIILWIAAGVFGPVYGMLGEVEF